MPIVPQAALPPVGLAFAAKTAYRPHVGLAAVESGQQPQGATFPLTAGVSLAP
jgi:hypothetical protein